MDSSRLKMFRWRRDGCRVKHERQVFVPLLCAFLKHLNGVKQPRLLLKTEKVLLPIHVNCFLIIKNTQKVLKYGNLGWSFAGV